MSQFFNNGNDGNLIARLANQNKPPLPDEAQQPINNLDLNVANTNNNSPQGQTHNFSQPNIAPSNQQISNSSLELPVVHENNAPQLIESKSDLDSPVDLVSGDPLIDRANESIRNTKTFNVNELKSLDFDTEFSGEVNTSINQTPSQMAREEIAVTSSPEMVAQTSVSNVLESRIVHPTPTASMMIPSTESNSPMMLPDKYLEVGEVMDQNKGNERLKDAHDEISKNRAIEFEKSFTYDELVSIVPNFYDNDKGIREGIINRFKKEVEEIGAIERNTMIDADTKKAKKKEFKNTVGKFTVPFIKKYLSNIGIQDLSEGIVHYYSKYLVDDMYDFSILTDILEDKEVTEIMVPKYDFILIEKNGKAIETNLKFKNWDHMKEVIDRMISVTGRSLTDKTPNVDARLPNKSRLSASIPPIAVYGPELTIRMFPEKPWQKEELLKRNSVSDEVMDFISELVKKGLSVLVSGGTGAGKTTLLNIVSNDINQKHRVVVIENTHELNLNLKHVVYQEERISDNNPITMNQLVINALRKAPKAIVVGEVRGGEAMALIQGLSTGHYGYGTLHADTPKDAFGRLNAMVRMSGIDWGVPVINRMICSAIQYIVQVSRFEDGSRKIEKVSEILGIDQEGAEAYGRVIGDTAPRMHDVSRYGTGYVYLHDIYTYVETSRDDDGKINGHWERSKYKPLHYKTLNRDGNLAKYWE